MKLNKPKTKKTQTRPNIPVEMKEFVTEGGEVGLKGTNLLTGEESKFYLTVPQTEESQARNKSRPTLEKWSGKFKIGRAHV